MFHLRLSDLHGWLSEGMSRSGETISKTNEEIRRQHHETTHPTRLHVQLLDEATDKQPQLPEVDLSH